MITIKIPYKNSDETYLNELKELQRVQSNIIRMAFNRFQDNFSETQASKLTKSIDNLKIGCWFNQSAIKEAKQIYSKHKDKNIIFGGKFNLKQYLTKKITKEEYKEKRLMPLVSIGEQNQKGNRHVELDIIENNSIVFKPKKGQKYNLKLPKLRTNYLKQLYWLEEQAKEKKIAYTIKLTKDFICISFEEKILEVVKPIENRVISVDLNPNSIGYSVCDYVDEEQKVVDTGIIEFKDLNKKLHKSSNSKEQLKQNNKRIFEQYQVVKFLIQKAKHFRCEKFIVEDLCIKAKDQNKGKNFNRLVNNVWNRTLFNQSIKKHCRAFGIKFVEVNPAYSSIIGNTLHSNYPDPICASIEINRRGHFKYIKGKFYPLIPSVDYLNELWKQTLDKSFESWVDISKYIKKSKVKYRFSYSNHLDQFKFFSLKHINSGLILYKPI